MSARYWVLVTDQLMASDPQWPEGLRIVEPDDCDTYCERDAPPGTSWELFEDDGAPASLAGEYVELAFSRSADKVMIASRTPSI
jgi:hypothetical protein